MIINKKKINLILIKKKVKQNGYCLIPSLYSKQDINKIKFKINNTFKKAKQIKKSGHYKRKMKDFFRLDVGEYKASIRLARFFLNFHGIMAI
tara:strand:+ start:209 stop:484 length:276 start_codon:yes stop_codon:yes gene_type:complete